MDRSFGIDAHHASAPAELSDDVAAMQASFNSLRQITPQAIDLATWYANVKDNSDGGDMAAPTQLSLAA